MLQVMALPLAVSAPPRRASWIGPILAVVAATAACRSAAPTKTAGPPAPPDFIRSYVGQTGILRSRGDQAKWSLDRNATERLSGECDAAVEVRDASFQKGTVQLRMETLGEPRLEGWRSRCKHPVPEVALKITGFRPDEPAATITTALSRLFATPEAWLGAHRRKFDLPPGPVPKAAADRSTVAKEDEMRLARGVTSWPKRLMWIETAWADPKHRVHHEGEIEVAGIVGADGRFYAGQVQTPMEELQQRQILRAFPLWRFEPARKGTEPVAARTSEKSVLRIY
jgi:hypothetical protein